jgi:hypothetical protein
MGAQWQNVNFEKYVYTNDPTPTPTIQPTATPTPTASPSPVPTAVPTANPTAVPTPQPTAIPTPRPTVQPTVQPTAQPTPDPTTVPILPPVPTFQPNPTATPAPTGKVACGTQAVGYMFDQNDANAQSVSYFKCTTAGSATHIIAYISSPTNGKAIAAIYSTSNGVATTLLKQSASANIGTSFGWVDFTLPSTTLKSGTTYGLAIMGDVTINVMQSYNGQRDHNAMSSFNQGFSNPFYGIWGSSGGAMSIYVK